MSIALIVLLAVLAIILVKGVIIYLLLKSKDSPETAAQEAESVKERDSSAG